jgi:hypothetical protein
VSSTELVHMYRGGECETSSQPPMPGVDEIAYVPIPYERDPRGTKVPESWHHAYECPFADPPDAASQRDPVPK